MGSQLELPVCGLSIAAGRDHKRWPDLKECKEIHLSVFQTNNLMHTFVKEGNTADARHLFDNMPIRDVVSWNIMILGYAKQEKAAHALELYARMQQEGYQPNKRTFVAVLKACSSLAALKGGKQFDGTFAEIGGLVKGRAIHAEVVKSGFESYVFVGTTLANMYAKYATMEDARCVFDELHHCDVVTWNTMIMGYAEQEDSELALTLYAWMRQDGLLPNDRSFVGISKACIGLAALEEGKQVDGKFLKMGSLAKGRAIHAHAVKNGFDSSAYVRNTLVNMYAKCGSMQDARRIFDQLPHRDVILWTIMILGYVEQEDSVLALEMFTWMHQEGITPDDRTFVSALKACSSLTELEEGKQHDGKHVKIGHLAIGRGIHSEVVKNGLESDVFVGNTLVNLYLKSRSMEDAWRVFDQLLHRNVVSWNTLIIGYAEQGESVLALGLYARMHLEGVQPNDRTFDGALKACSILASLEEGKQSTGRSAKRECAVKGRAIHSHIVKGGFESEVFVGTALVDMYAKCGNMEDAECVFVQLPYRNVVTWTTLILGYAEREETEEAFRIYAQMQEQGLLPSSITFVTILKVCGSPAALRIGKELHSQIIRAGFETISILVTSLIDMYAKGGSMADAQHLFDALPTRDCTAWSALIAGYSRQGESALVFVLFDRMRLEGIEPNSITFLSVLTVCSHVGLVVKSQEYFHSMREQYGIIPTIEHYTCMVDVLGRAGRMDEAVGMVKKMPFKPDVNVWLAVLSACQKWKNVEVGTYAFQNVLRLDKNIAAAYILMASIYADAHVR